MLSVVRFRQGKWRGIEVDIGPARAEGHRTSLARALDETESERETAMAKQYWLVKSEPDVYSIDDLERDGSTMWDGVRNYRARNNMRDMKVGDEVLYYHSNAKPPGDRGHRAGGREAYPDPTQFDAKSQYYDEKSSKEDPRWSLVDVAFVAKLPEPVGLDEVKAEPPSQEMELVRYGRLSVQSVGVAEFKKIQEMGGL